MKNAASFLTGCMTGALVTFLLYFSTAYITQTTFYAQITRDLYVEASTDETPTIESENVQKWSTKKLVPLSSGFLSSTANLLFPVVFTARKEMADTLYSTNMTWGAQREGWAVAVGAEGARITSSGREHDNLLLMERCEDFDGVALSAGQLFCLLTSLYEDHVDKYQWFLIVHRSTYVALNQLVKNLVGYDSNKVFYIGRRSSYSVPKMNRLGLVKHEHICELDSGIVLSRGALRAIAPLLRHCLGSGLSRGLAGSRGLVGGVELGRCFSRMLGVTCSEEVSVFRVWVFCKEQHIIMYLPTQFQTCFWSRFSIIYMREGDPITYGCISPFIVNILLVPVVVG